ncbi:uncharacterized protein LOC125946451 [Dermacentor silvarum]|uniref:uncharacterized protein LOC125946451 n=1 Tax=Dermacentor silvarum TaxID=543639 RepID=UPI002101D2A9|nr:uncharacterized protein LOC125946451 [Dermacentor silvarum]
MMASSSFGIASNENADETTGTLPRSSTAEVTTKPSHAACTVAKTARLIAEYSQMNMQVSELQARQEFEYLRPSRVEKFRDAMDASVLRLTRAAEQSKSQLSEGHDIVVNRKLVKECKSMASLVRDIGNSKRLQNATTEDLTWKGFDLEKLRMQQEVLSAAADGVDADIKKLQERIGQL